MLLVGGVKPYPRLSLALNTLSVVCAISLQLQLVSNWYLPKGEFKQH
jgi:hypothetical protein